SGGAWVDNVAIGCAKTKLKVADPGPSEDLYRWLRSPPTAADLQRVLDDAEAVAHIDEESDYDLLLEVKKKADAMTQEELRREMIESDKRVWLMDHKYSEDDEMIEDLAYIADKSPLEYEKLRETAAERLNCRAPVLDKLIEARLQPKPVDKPAA